jgi:hypothetical protein
MFVIDGIRRFDWPHVGEWDAYILGLPARIAAE